ncbi:MAG: hypothetical protein COW65_17090 [Cytophagales bacterium CG18_big_fil_WC_8_21_14_2_50_42_9]|nr:MAG: hypothetical protein COW65_17090 [Cytophagales bacterium CG18_big_fil_WC_8_21_14_2_50_42_9]
MELKDLFLTPIYLLLLYAIAYSVRPKATTKLTKQYFIPALTLKFIGAIGLGLVYQFYYGGGDTYNYFHHVKIVYHAFTNSPILGLKLVFSQGEHDPLTYQYASQMEWYRAPTEFFVIRVAALISFVTFCTYTPIAIFFAFLSFTGMWALYITFLDMYPSLHRKFAIAIFFLPSVFFWGSGLMKDSLTIGALGWLFYGFYFATIKKKNILKSVIIGFLAAYVVYTVKVYVLLSFLPPAIFWVFTENSRKIKNALLRNLLKPVFIGVGLVMAYFGATNLTEGDARYDVNKIAERSRINNAYLSQQMASGSAYNIGVYDGSLSSIITVGPQAIVVSLYRPFLFEVRNPLMLLSAIEASIFIYFTVLFIYKVGFFKTIKFIRSKPVLTFCMIFSFVLAFAVGTNSGNFGSLVRYKIPLMPFYLAALFIMQAHLKRPKKVVRLATTA